MKKVAILGRPNVGKSSLFNALIRKKEAIVSEKENMTRDVKYGIVSHGKLSFQLVDMGGLTDGKGDFLDLVNIKIKQEVETSDLVIVLLDIREIASDDRRVLEYARKHAKDFMVVANKADEEKVEELYHDIHRLGVGEFLAISCKNYKKLNVLRAAILDRVGEANAIIEPKKKEIKIAILGRPNVGKSSLLNVFLGEERAIVSSISGTTRDSVDGFFIHGDRNFRVIDTAGIRKKGKSKEEEEEKSLKQSIRCSEEADVVLLMIDALEQLGTQDKKIAQTVKNRNKPILLVVNKWDISPYPWKEYLLYLYSEFPLLKEWKIMAISCEKKKGIGELKKAILDIYKENNVAFEKKELSTVIKDAILRQPPPRVGGKRLQFHDWKQTSRAPIILQFRVNDTALIQKNYIKYLINMVKNHFSLNATDVKMVFKDKKDE